MRRQRSTASTRRSGIADADVVYEDDHLLVANKPVGVTTKADRSDSRRSLHDAVLDHVRSNADASMRVRPVNHLDRTLSGLVVFAKSKQVENSLETLFRRNKVRRTYSAVVYGTFDAGASAAGTVQSSIEDHRKRSRRSKAPERQASPSVTHYRVVKQANDVSLVQLRPETHRKDQLIMHMRKIHHPVVGDSAAAPRGRQPSPLMLHLEEVTFEHPQSGRDVRAFAPAPPEFDRIMGNTSPKQHQQASDAAETSWQPVAEWYSAYQSTARSDHFADVIHPGALALLGDTRDKYILDVACGEGTFATLLTQRGAAIVGVDAARGLIERARAKQTDAARFLVGDASRLADLGDKARGPFDAATCIMALMNIADLDATLAGIASRLKEGSTFVAVLLHPAFRSPKQTSWGWDCSDRDRQLQYRRVDAYLSETNEPITMNPGHAAHGAKPVETHTFHRPISAYVRALNSAGFAVHALEEWPSVRISQPGPRANEENRARAEIPLFLGIRAVRVSRITS